MTMPHGLRRYQRYCFADPQFYDPPRCWAVEETGFAEARLETPEGWLRTDRDPWLLLAPAGRTLPDQGWKIHISTCLEDADAILKTTYGYCVAGRVAFAFLPTRSLVIARNLRYAERADSGGFIVVYPPDETELRTVLTELGELLRGRRGPALPGFVRWESGPLHVHYGGFVDRYCRDERGEPVPAVTDPSGAPVPADRHPPEWVRRPAFLDHAADPDPPAEPPYPVERALRVCTGGGIYLANDPRTGHRVVLKEARPYAGLEPNGADAVTRLEREWDSLTALADVDEVVTGFAHFALGERRFLVREYVEGEPLGRAILRRHPLVRADCPDERITGYTEWALAVLDRIEAGLARVHERGIALGDLHPDNILVRPDGRIVFVDFELSYRDGEVATVGVGAPGYVPPDGRTGPAADRYALACLRLAMFLPLTPLFALDSGAAKTLAGAVQERFPVPAGYGDRVVRALRLKPAGYPDTVAQRRAVGRLVATLNSAEPDWTGLSASMAAAILASATPQRPDRLFPGDIEQFATGGLGLAHGAAGVLYALSATGHGRHPEHEEWLLRGVRAGRGEPRAGLYDGLHGIAYALSRLGRPDDAAQVLERALAVPPEDLPSDLFGGLAGVGLNLLYFAGHDADHDADPARLDAAVAAGEVLAGRFDTRPGAAGRAGLLRGATGYALLFLRLFERTGDGRWLDRAGRAVRHDLGRVAPEGVGVGGGATGVGLVLRDYLGHRPDADLAARLAGIERAAGAEFVAGPGLFTGRAGLLAFLARGRVAGDPDPVREAAIERHRRRLAWHAVGYRGHVAFPGEHLLRLSMDLGTGTAGILLALAAERGEVAPLPFLDRRP